MVSVLHGKQTHIRLHNAIINMTSFAIMHVVMCAILYDAIVHNNLSCFKIVYNKMEFQIFGMNMTFISSPHEI